MSNLKKILPLAGAVLITTSINGSILWGLNGMATEGAAATASTVAGRLPAAAESRPEVRYLTLAPVVVVGRRTAATAETAEALAPATASACPLSAMNTTALSGQPDGASRHC